MVVRYLASVRIMMTLQYKGREQDFELLIILFGREGEVSEVVSFNKTSKILALSLMVGGLEGPPLTEIMIDPKCMCTLIRNLLTLTNYKKAAKPNMSGAVCASSMYKLSHCTRFDVIRVILLFYCALSNPTICKFIVNRLILLYQD